MTANRGCWTCKKRKIGCDRSVPSCNKCLRSGRQCLGYNLRLIWADQPDGRRKKPLAVDTAEWRQPTSSHYGTQFLNVGFGDIVLTGEDGISLDLGRLSLASRPRRSLTLRPDLGGEAGLQLMSYYEGRLSKMISTVDISNGFREVLLPMALSSTTAASDGLRNAMMAVSAFHRFGTEASLTYKSRALRSLSTSLSQREGSTQATLETQLAASMMLCVYNVFDEREMNWHLHLNGARNLIWQLASSYGGQLESSFVYTWFLYHEILGNFSQCFSGNVSQSQVSSLELIGDSDFDQALIIGSLGCSLQVLAVIDQLNEFRLSKSGISEDTTHRLEHRLLNLTQKLDDRDEAGESVTERSRILATAELYRISTLIYLLRVSSSENQHPHIPAYVDQAFQTLESLALCTSPWPLFVVACEAQSDAHRMEILQKLDLMDERRNIGNVFVLRDIIESYWKQQDLVADSKQTTPPKWWNMVNSNTAAPWFI